ncbi:hypothetical protein TREMEDRAFT_65629 [Tremella mesenterica DSM 1558]|uniref:uncharacterized protein n=1 Tax=Tremella mesenterica (strain ATCC 24925 / CBS 8224 / DSM 1558 / NBRC 9311 / NRRL Y-6157 / RJB 2259-6 / UBC 559-6) TaxID=578456 RepID=UPI00032CCE0B|nr:uncharacterized protein TREMEDRAFT_65629 [Tremella mesenterica DSM 1558]EIW66351.1 hypothetical protein TREMEDRAFT_65629 [Tremella mesenterica DSM 1558]
MSLTRRQIAQQARRERERGLREQSELGNEDIPGPSRREIGQRSRRDQERIDSHCRARRDYIGGTSVHQLGRCEVPCPKCAALHWLEERAINIAAGGERSSLANPLFSGCCSNGAVQLPLPLDPPLELRDLLTDQTHQGKLRREQLRNYNNSLAFTSMGVDKQDMQVWGPQGIYTFRIGGRAYHQIGALLPEAGEHPRFAQVFLAGLSEAEQAAQRNIHIRGRGEEGVLTRLAQMIERVNPYYAAFKTFRDRDRESEEDTPILYLTVLNPLQNDPRRYNRPTSDEVACVYVADENEPSPGRHIQVYLRGGGVRNISELHSAYLPLHFTLIYPHGEPGWHPRIPLAGQPLGDDDEIGEGEDIEDGNAGDRGLVAEVRRYGRGGSKRVTQAQFATYYLFKRLGSFNTALYCGRLFQELLVDQWAQTESNRLRWIRENQTTLRADSYKGLVDAVDAGIPLADVGKKVVLPSTFAGSPRGCKDLGDRISKTGTSALSSSHVPYTRR